MAEVNGSGADRRGEHRREDDRWLRDLIEQVLVDRNRQVRRVLLSVASGYLILLFGIGIALYTIEKRDAERADKAIQAARLVAVQNTRATTAECKRVNKLRRQANVSSDLIYATLYTSARRERALAKAQPTPGLVHTRSARVLEFLASQALHTDLTACRPAVRDARHYHAPKPRPFTPTTSDLLRELRKIGASG